jgi:hypothetical protein
MESAYFPMDMDLREKDRPPGEEAIRKLEKKLVRHFEMAVAGGRRCPLSRTGLTERTFTVWCLPYARRAW